MKKRLYWGVMFLAAAVFIVLNAMDLLDGLSIFSIVFSVLLVPVIITGIQKHNFALITFPLAFIAIMFDETLGIESFTPWPALATALLSSIGLTLLFPRKHAWYNTKPESHPKYAGVGEQEYNDGENITINTRFNGSTRYIRSKTIRSVNIDASYAGAKIYFDNADIDGKEAVINIDSSFSGVELFIPRNWHVDNEISVMMGGVKEVGAEEADVTVKTIVLRGNCGFSGVTIHRI